MYNDYEYDYGGDFMIIMKLDELFSLFIIYNLLTIISTPVFSSKKHPQRNFMSMTMKYRAECQRRYVI
jgi:hypothetical protein